MTQMLAEPLLSVAPEADPEGKDTRRFFHMRDVEWRDSGNGAEYTFVGTATVFGSWSELLWTPRGVFRERFIKGAFADVLKGQHDVRFLKNHDKNLVLARTKSGTLELEETDERLRVWARVAKTSYATDLKLSMERGDIDQMSIQFELDYDRGAESRWYEDKRTGEVCHDVVRVSDLYDVSVVTFPAYAETSAAMRDLDRAQARGLIQAPRAASQKKCPSCGEMIPADATKCPDCGAMMQEEASSAASILRTATPRSYKRCRQMVAETSWAMLPSYLNMIMGILDERSAGGKPALEEIRDRVGAKRDNLPTQVGSAAVIPLVGPIMSRAGAMSEISGAKSLGDFKAEFRQALADPEISSIILDIDSPGGTVDGVPEMAAEIQAARGTKPIVAVANYMAASAAYWIACAADELVASPSAEVGSVGVYCAHQDRSAEMEKKGVKTTFVHAGENKVELNPYQPLSEEAKARLQADVDAIYETFLASVADARGVPTEDVVANFGQGRTKGAKEALASGMIDRIATLDEIVAEFGGTVQSREAIQVPSGNNYVSDTPLNYPADSLETRELAREFLGLAARAETDLVGTRTDAPSEDTVVEADSIAALKSQSQAEMQRAREERVRLTKEMLK